MDISIVYRQTKKNIIDAVNASGLPYDMIVYALKEVLRDAEEQAEINYQSELKKEIAKMEEKARKEELIKLQEEAKNKEMEMQAEEEEDKMPFPLPDEAE